MNFVFFGTPQFAATILERLIEADFVPSLVVTNPDRPVGRKQVITPPPVKDVALSHDLSVLQPESLTTKNPAKGEIFESAVVSNGPGLGASSLSNDFALSRKLSAGIKNEPRRGFAPLDPGLPSPGPHSALGPYGALYQKQWDFFLVVAYGKIIPKSVLDIPRLGTVNVHPSLLPKYRGPTPIQTAILNGDDETGVSLMLLDAEVDHGPLLQQRKFKIQNHKSQTLADELAEVSAEMLIETIPQFVDEKITPKEQDHAAATFTKKFMVDDARVEYDDLVRAFSGEAPDEAARIDRMIRALNPEPGVWTMTNDTPVLDLPKHKRVKLLDAEIADGKLVLKQVQVEGKQPRSL